MTLTIINTFGWVGAILLLFAYSSNIMGKLSNNSYKFLGINLTGAILLVINAYYFNAYPFLVINIFWVFVSVYQLYVKNKEA